MSTDRPILVGIRRDESNPKLLLMFLSAEPSNEVMQDIHDALTVDKPVVAYQVSMNRKHQPDLLDDWSPWRNIHEENLYLYRNRAKHMPNLVKVRALIVKE